MDKPEAKFYDVNYIQKPDEATTQYRVAKVSASSIEEVCHKLRRAVDGKFRITRIALEPSIPASIYNKVIE